MSTTGKRSLGLRVLKFMLGTDQLSVAIAAIGVCVALGTMYVFNIIDITDRPKPPLWQAIAAGVALSALLIPFFFMAVSRTLPFMSPWEGVATLTAAMLTPAIMQRMSALGITNPFLFGGGCIGFIVVTFLITRWIQKRNRSSRP